MIALTKAAHDRLLAAVKDAYEDISGVYLRWDKLPESIPLGRALDRLSWVQGFLEGGAAGADSATARTGIQEGP